MSTDQLQQLKHEFPYRKSFTETIQTTANNEGMTGVAAYSDLPSDHSDITHVPYSTTDSVYPQVIAGIVHNKFLRKNNTVHQSTETPL